MMPNRVRSPIILFSAALAALWASFGPRIALGVLLTVFGYLFVLAMRIAQAEVLKMKGQNPSDFHSFSNR